MIASALSGHPEQQSKHLEFVKFDQKVFDEIEMEMRKANSVRIYIEILINEVKIVLSDE